MGRNYVWNGECYQAQGDPLPDGIYDRFQITGGCITQVYQDQTPAGGGDIKPRVKFCAVDGTYEYNPNTGELVKTVENGFKDGVYTEISVEGGCIRAFGTALLPSMPVNDCCDDNDTPGTLQTVKAARIECNLSSVIAGNEVLTNAFFDNTSCFTVSGCGTSDSPWKIAPRISAQDSCNLLTCSPDGLRAKLFFRANTLISFSGCGSEASPLEAILSSTALSNAITQSMSSANTENAINIPMKDVSDCPWSNGTNRLVFKELRYDYGLGKWAIGTNETATVSTYPTYAAAKTAYLALPKPACPVEPIQGA